MHAQIVLFDGFDPLDVIAPYEVLYAGGTASGGAVSVEGLQGHRPSSPRPGRGRGPGAEETPMTRTDSTLGRFPTPKPPAH